MTEETDWAGILYTALGAKIGVLVDGNDFAGVRGRLYAERKALGDPALEVLEVRQSPIKGGCVVIVKKQGKGGGPALPAIPPKELLEL